MPAPIHWAGLRPVSCSSLSYSAAFLARACSIIMSRQRWNTSLGLSWWSVRSIIMRGGGPRGCDGLSMILFLSSSACMPIQVVARWVLYSGVSSIRAMECLGLSLVSDCQSLISFCMSFSSSPYRASSPSIQVCSSLISRLISCQSSLISAS